MTAKINLFAAPSCSTATGLIVGQCLDNLNVPSNILTYDTLPSQSVMITAASGVSTLLFSGYSITGFVLGSDPSVLQTRLNALPVLGPGATLVRGINPYEVQFQSPAAVPLISVDTSGLLATGSVTRPTTPSGTTPAFLLDCSSASFSSVGQWATGNGGQSRSTPSTGTGLAQCQWLKSGIAPGYYQAYVSTASPGGASSSSTPLRVMDGSNPFMFTRINQQTLPNQISLLGADVQLTTSLYVSSGSDLRIEITDQTLAGDIGQTVNAYQVVISPYNPTAPNILTISLNPSYVFQGNPSDWHTYNNAGTWNNVGNYTQVPNTTFTWIILGVVPGIHSLQVQFDVEGNWDTAASYQVFADGAAYGPPVVINQQTVIPAGLTLTDNQPRAQTFINLGNFPTTTGTFHVVLTSSAGTGSGGIFGCSANACLASLVSTFPYVEPVSGVVNAITTGPPILTVNSTQYTLGQPIFRNDPAHPSNCYPFLEWPIPLSAPLQSSDILSLSASPNTFGLVAGSVPQLTNQSVSNKIDSRLTPPDPDHITLGVGLNLVSPGFGGPLYSNSAWNATGLIYAGQVNPPPSLDSQGYPASRIADQWYLSIGTSVPDPLTSTGFPCYPLSGTTTVIFDCPVGCYIGIGINAGTACRLLSLNTGHATGNEIQVELTLDGSGNTIAPQFSLFLQLFQDWCDDADAGRFTPASGSSRMTGAGWNGAYYSCPNTNAATFSLGRQFAGTYEIGIAYPPSGSNTAVATVTVKESGSPIASFTVDQTQNPGSYEALDYNQTRLKFNPNAQTYTCSGGPITVEIHGNGSGNCIQDCIFTKLTGNLVSGTPIAPVTTPVQLYDPLIADPHNPDEFHPLFLQAIGSNPKVLRSMQLQGANDSAQIEYADYAQPGRLCYGAGAQRTNYLLLEAQNFNDIHGYFQNNKAPVLMTVSAINGAVLPIISGTPLGLPNNLVVTWTTGGVSDLSLYFSSVYHDPALMMPNQFAMASGFVGDISGTASLLPTPPATDLGSCLVSYKSIPWPSYFRLVALFPNCKAWINVSPIVSQSCIELIMADSITYLPADRPRYLEISNEPWNFFYAQFPYFLGLANTLSLAGSQAGYALVATQRHAWATAALGPLASTLIRVFNCAAANPSTATPILNYCNDNGFPIDAIACAPYLFAEPADEAGLENICQDLSAAQLVDCLDAFSAFGNSTQQIAASYQAITAAQTILSGRRTYWCCYEGGIPGNSMGGTTLAQFAQAIATRYHPQEGQALLGHFAVLQSYDCVDLAIYNIDQLPGGDFAFSVYGVTLGWFNPPGKGDGTDGNHNNIPDILGAPPSGPNLLLDVSPMAYAMNIWNEASGGQSVMPLLFYLRQRMGS